MLFDLHLTPRRVIQEVRDKWKDEWDFLTGKEIRREKKRPRNPIWNILISVLAVVLNQRVELETHKIFVFRKQLRSAGYRATYVRDVIDNKKTIDIAMYALTIYESIIKLPSNRAIFELQRVKREILVAARLVTESTGTCIRPANVNTVPNAVGDTCVCPKSKDADGDTN